MVAVAFGSYATSLFLPHATWGGWDNVFTTAIVLVFFAIDTAQNAPQTFAAIVAIAALCVVLDLIWKHLRHVPPEPAPPPSL